MSDDSGIDWMASADSEYKKAMVEVVEMAEKEHRCCYLYLSKFGVHTYLASSSHWKDEWLFRAFPGGRKSLSNAGKKHLKDCQL